MNQVDYATAADFCRVFDDHIDTLYTLSYLLTADRDKAEQCFVSGLEDCQRGNPVFRDWAQSWARRTVVMNAIRMISPLRNETETASGMREPIAETNTPATAITNLQPFDRFVYVLTVLEKYSDHECAILLGCTLRRVVDARISALQQLAGSVTGRAESAVRQGAA